MGYNVNVDVDKCVGCGECVDVCPVEVYEIKDGKSEAVNAEECLGCESCVEVCEVSAITVEENYGLHGCPRGILLLTHKVFIVPPGAHAPGGIFIGTSRFPAIPPHVFRTTAG